MVEFDPVVYNASEGGQAVLRVVLSNPSSEEVRVTVTTMDGSATEDSDYEPEATVVVFQPGETEATLPIDISDDEVNELPESFSAVLSAPEGAQLGDDMVATINIMDDDGKNKTFEYREQKIAKTVYTHSMLNRLN